MGQVLLMAIERWRLVIDNRPVVLIKPERETREHLLMKVLLFSLYRIGFSGLRMEVTGGKWVPDLIEGYDDRVAFWGEVGKFPEEKIRWVAKKYPNAYLVLAKWNVDLDSFQEVVSKTLSDIERNEQTVLYSFPSDSPERFVSPSGIVSISFDNVPQRILP